MNRFAIPALIAASALTSACGPETNRLTPISNPSIYSANQPVVQRNDFVLDVSAAGGGLPAAERARLDDWFDSLDLSYGDKVYIDESSYSAPTSRSDIAAIIAEYGLLLSDGAPFSAGSAAPGMIRVIVSRTKAFVPGCPVHENEQVGAPETTSTNFGCATNSNLANMIADPNDLVRGQSSDGMRDSIQGSKAVKIYRDRTPTGSGSK
jgi:pilus assembly protein CpaD